VEGKCGLEDVAIRVAAPIDVVEHVNEVGIQVSGDMKADTGARAKSLDTGVFDEFLDAQVGADPAGPFGLPRKTVSAIGWGGHVE
jgi:hypothetical protein